MEGDIATLPVAATIRPAQLHRELKAAGHGPKILTVRGFGPNAYGVCSSGEVAHDGTLTAAQLAAVVGAHVPSQTAEQKLGNAAVRTMVEACEAGTATPLQQQALIAKLARFLRREVFILLFGLMPLLVTGCPGGPSVEICAEKDGTKG